MVSQQRTILFSGTVQGVGFRYAACRVAGGHEVAGYVRNLPDGRVECVVEGEPGAIDAFVGELRRRMAAYIDAVDQRTAPPTGRYRGFTVAF